MSKPRVLRILNRFNLGGPTYNAAYLTRYLEPDFETRLIGGEKDESEGSSLHITDGLGIKPHVISSMKREVNLGMDREAYREIRKHIQEFKPQIVHTHASKAGALGRLAALHENVPVIVHTFHGHVFHGYFNPLKTHAYKYIERYLARKSDQIIAISDIQKNELCNIHRIAAESKTSVIPLGFDLDRFREDKAEKRMQFREKYTLSTDTLAIGIIGRLVPIKNHELFLKAIDACKSQAKQKIQAYVIGDGETKLALQTFIQENTQLSFSEGADASADVIFTSWIKEVDQALAGLDLVCLTSLNEGTPVSLIEAQAAGKPIVSTNVGGIENVVLPNKSALLSPLGEDTKFIENLVGLVDDSEKLTAMSTAGEAFVFEHFHYRRLAADVKKLYNYLLNQKSN
ncbi:glycosyltransferase [bacterium SCSIO 12741]|nr:glycosyltransferase [bacterium SCSIO 12741]